MRAIEAATPGGPEVMKLVERPSPTPKANEARVKVEAAGVNYIDVYFRAGLYKQPAPILLGNEGAGTIDALGEGVTTFKVGQRVAWSGVNGSYATEAIVPAARLVAVPDNLDSKSAAAALLQGMTAHYLVTSTYALARDEKCLVHAAAGGVGTLLCQLAKRRGAYVFGTVSTREKAEIAKAAGADEAILYTETDFEVEIDRRTRGEKVSVVYDSVGKTTFEKSLGCLRPRGMMVLYGQSSGPVPPVELQIFNTKGALFFTRPTLGHYTATREELDWRAGEIFSAIADGSLRLSIQDTLPLERAADAHRMLESRATTGKLLLIP